MLRRARTAAMRTFARTGVRVPNARRSCIRYGSTAKRRIESTGPFSARGGIIAFTREPSGRRASTLLNILSSAIPNNERIITIEDSAELQLQQEHVVRLETRPPNIEGTGAVTQRDMLRNALRMRPDRIIVGEVRGAEALDMLQAMNTGHDGSLSTVHANSTRDAMSRIETMVLMAGLSLPVSVLREYIVSAINIIVHVARLTDGTRKVLRVTEVVGMEEAIITTQDIFLFEQEGIDPNGRVVGVHRATGVRPKFSERLLRAGIDLGPEIFVPSRRRAVH